MSDGWQTISWGAIAFAAIGVAIVAVAACIGLIHDAIRQRKTRRDIQKSQSELFALAAERAASLSAIKEAISLAGLHYLRLDRSGAVLERNQHFAGLERGGDRIESFDLAALSEKQEFPPHVDRTQIEREIAGRKIRWGLGKSRPNEAIEAIGIEIGGVADETAGAKATFLATISHEMRTPLNGVVGMASLLRETTLTPEQRNYVAAIESSGEALLTLISEILDFSRIEAGKLEIISEDVEIEPLLEGVVELLAPRAQDKGIEIAAFVHPEVPVHIVSDGARLRQVLMNLAGNAVKFTETGGVGVRVDCERGMLVISVADTGPGIAADRLDAIFREFEQANDTVGRTHGGTGLGLAISRRIVERLGGSVSVVSKPGAGSLFRVVLPLSAARGADAGRANAACLASERIVLVSQSPFAAAFLAERLEAFGASVSLSQTFEAAMPSLVGATSILVDATLGIEIARTIAEAATAARIWRRLILLSPYERRDVGAPFDLGFTGYLVKPVRSRSLLARFDRAGMPTPTGESSAPPKQVLAGARVLIAEDNEINALLARRLVERLGGIADVVGSGALALTKLGQSSEPYALALFDVRMPGMTGIEAVAIWRRSERETGSARLPIIALTANASIADRQECIAAGFDAFLPKPLDLHAFQDLLADIIAARLQAA